MNKKNKNLEILAIGLDPVSIEALKKNLKETKLKHSISFIQDISQIASSDRKSAHAVFFYSSRQNQKTIQDIRRIHLAIPGASITLLCPRTDHHGIVAAFRAGLFDFLTLPIEPGEIRAVIYRLKILGAIHSGQWNPERAVLHLFSRPESFSSKIDIASSLNQYIELFFETDVEIDYRSSLEMIEGVRKKFKLSENRMKRLNRFISDETGLIFGLNFQNDRFTFLIKKGDDQFTYLSATNRSDYPIKDIMSDYLSNVLRTSLSILLDSKKNEAIRMLSLTDEVTGMYNQRKLVEDLEFYIARYAHEKMGFSLLFVDIDYFKNVNDNYGHVVGSQLLIDMAKVVKGQLRSTDLVYRYGGDEFIVLLPRTSLEETKKIALRVSEAVKASEFNIDEEKKYRLSLSVGIAEFPTDATDAKSVIEFADKMMYLSKKSGRGKVFHVTEVVE